MITTTTSSSRQQKKQRLHRDCIKNQRVLEKRSALKADDDWKDEDEDEDEEVLRRRNRRTRRYSMMTMTMLTLVSSSREFYAFAAMNSNNSNSAIVQALKQKQNADDVEFATDIRQRLSVTLASFRRAKLLSDVGEYGNARQLLREGGASSLRKDLQKVASYVALRRPTFAEYEAAETVGTLEAWDNAMRAMEVPEKQRKGDQRNVTANDVKTDANAAIKSLEEVVYLVNADATYVDAQKRLKNVDLEKEYDGE
jgi:hypothetical protein